MRRWKSGLGRWIALSLTAVSCVTITAGPISGQEIPELLRPWQDWVTWDVKHRDCPTLYSQSDQRVCFWPSRLHIAANAGGGQFTIKVRAFEDVWLPLPGSTDVWPTQVRIAEEETPVIERDGHPVVRLKSGVHEVAGTFLWKVMPQRILIPGQIGILSLQVDGNSIDNPIWDANGNIWLKRTQGKPADKDLLSLQINRLIEDGIPLWLETEVELTVSGKSREEHLGWVLPAGWRLSSVNSPIPVAIDDRGDMKAQVRAGKWTVSLRAFRTTEANQIAFAAGAQTAVTTELIGLKTDPQFRISQLEEIPTIDVTQTTYPTKWRRYSVHQWDTARPFRLVEQMRGTGNQNPPGLSIHRQLWLDEDGSQITYRDLVAGKMQRTWRLDVADGHELGAVRVDGEAQLITANPETGASGTEIRRRELSMTAIGRIDRSRELPAIGWQTDAEDLRVIFTLPPGWRTFAVFGADEVTGDWLTAWSLLDLFLLLVFSFAVFRLHGITVGVVALLAFGLAYHELGAPRLTWLFLLMPLALLRVVADGTLKKCVTAWKFVAIALLLFTLVPFIALQTQGVIYPQLERTGYVYGSRGVFSWPGEILAYPIGAHHTANRQPQSAMRPSEVRVPAVAVDLEAQSVGVVPKSARVTLRDTSNLRFAATSRIQTGPAQPRWNWNQVSCVWNGPVTSQQTIQPVFVSLTQHRILSTVRIVLLLLLAAILLRERRFRLPLRSRRIVAALGIMLLALPLGTASAQFPDRPMLEDLQQRLLESHDLFPNAAEIPAVVVTVAGTQIEMDSEIHAAREVAVPLPGKLPRWSPLSVTLDGVDAAEITRRDGYLWVLVPKGVHHVVVKGRLPDETDWDWTFLLQPKTVRIDAPDWNVTGLDPNGVPGSQVLFVREQASSADRAAYDRTNFAAIVVVDRHLEFGLISKVRTVVSRLSASGKGVSLSIPLLEGESVLTAKSNIQDGNISVQLAASQQETSWESELPSANSLQLRAPESNQWVERWHLVTSPIWNVSLQGLQPIYEPSQQDLVPVWHPWPGEEVTVSFSKPVALQGEVVTVQNVDYETKLGRRLRSCKLTLDLECSVANDFVIQLNPSAEQTSLEIDDQFVPTQLTDAGLIVPAQPGKQTVTVDWKQSEPLTLRTRTGDVILPVEASNVTTAMQVPDNRWVLWAAGPMRGPAVRFWTILAVAILASIALGSLSRSPLKQYEWTLLAIGLTQAPMIAVMFVITWLFLLSWRGDTERHSLGTVSFNLVQLTIVFLTVISLGVLTYVVSQGLLGNPDMFIAGNGSSRTLLRWFEPRVNQTLPTASIFSVSVWFYRLLMLFWALWLAVALLRWLTWGWRQFNEGGAWKRRQKPIVEATLVTDPPTDLEPSG